MISIYLLIVVSSQDLVNPWGAKLISTDQVVGRLQFSIIDIEKTLNCRVIENRLVWVPPSLSRSGQGFQVLSQRVRFRDRLESLDVCQYPKLSKLEPYFSADAVRINGFAVISYPIGSHYECIRTREVDVLISGKGLSELERKQIRTSLQHTTFYRKKKN